MPADSVRIALRRAVRATVPERPGVYTWLGKDGERLYVGKSVNLRQRMLSYLAPGQTANDRPRRHLASAIEQFEWQETGGELMALLLEDVLIKRFNPRHNERQKDYRERRYLLLTADEFPTCLVVDGPTARAGALFGPFKDEYFTRDLIELIADVFQLRACHDREPYRRSARFDLGSCLGPCRGAVAAQDYAEIVEHVRAFLGGEPARAVASLTAAMQAFSDELRFEEAAATRESMEFCVRFCARQRFFRAFEEGITVEESLSGLSYRFAGGALCTVRDRSGCEVRFPEDLAERVTDRRRLLDRANLVYGWLGPGRREEFPGDPPAAASR